MAESLERLAASAASTRRVVGDNAMSLFERVVRADSGGFTVAVFDEPAESLLASDLPRRELQVAGLLQIGLGQRHVALTLVGPIVVVVFQELPGDMPQVLLTQDQEVIETLPT